MNQSTHGILLKIVAIALFGLMDVCLKHLSHHYGSFQVAFFRGATALPLVFVFLYSTGGIKKLKTSKWKLHMARGVIGVIMLSSIIFAFSEMKLADAYAIFYSAPLLVTLMSVFILKEHVGPHRWAALAIGLSAVMLMLKPSDTHLSMAVIACAFGTLLYAILIIIMKILHRTESTAVQTFYYTLSITIGAAVLASTDWRPVRIEDIWILVVLGFTAASALYLLTDAYGKAPASLLAPYEYTAMIWALLFGYMFWRELPTPVMIIGASVVGITGLYILYRERIHEPQGTVVEHPIEIEKP